MSVNSSTFHPEQLCRAPGELEVQSHLIMGRDKGKTPSLATDIHRSQASSLLISVLTQPVLLFTVPVPKIKRNSKKIPPEGAESLHFSPGCLHPRSRRGLGLRLPPCLAPPSPKPGCGKQSEHFLV